MWTVEKLASKGKELNQELKDRFIEYSEGDTRLDYAIAFSVLGIANNVYDLEKRDKLVELLHQKNQANDLAYKDLAIRKWSPVKKAIEVFSEIVLNDNTPKLDSLLDQQQIKIKKASPSWSTLMPDKIYAIASFWNGIYNDKTARLQTPFGRAVQEAYSKYSGVQIKSQPTPTHHTYLHNFEINWARWGKCDVMDINSGLQCYAIEENLV